jgi:predicted aconitase with swiveling domain
MKEFSAIAMILIVCVGLITISTQRIKAQEASCASKAIEAVELCLAGVLGVSVSSAIICAFTGPAAIVCAGADAGVTAAAAAACIPVGLAEYAWCELNG